MKESGRASIPLLGGLLVLITGIVVWTLTRSPVNNPPVFTTEPGVDVATAEATPVVAALPAAEVLPAGSLETVVDTATEIPSDKSSKITQNSPIPTSDSAELSQPSDDAGLSQAELTEIGTAAYSDGEFELLKQLIREQPVILEQLLAEFRANSDPDRAGRLAELLGQFDDQSITDIGSEMAFSGDLVSQKAGLELLGRQQTRSSAARAVVTQVLEVESNPDVLVPALNAISKSSRVSADEQQNILNQLSSLSTHQDARVRSHSFALIKGWSKDVNMNSVLIQGLEDPDVRVRESATFALVKTQFPSDDVKFALLSRLEDPNEKKSIREGSFNALRRFDLTFDEQTRLDAALKLLNQ